MGYPSFPPLRPRRGLPELEERTRRGTSSDSRTGEGETAALRPSLVLLLLSEIPSASGRETPCPLNGVTGLPWLRGTPWNRRHRRAQRKAHLFWKNIIRTRARHEPHQGRCSPALASLLVHGLTLCCARWECNWSSRAFFEEMTGRYRLPGAWERWEKQHVKSEITSLRLALESLLATFVGGIDSVYYLASGERLTYVSSAFPCSFD